MQANGALDERIDALFRELERPMYVYRMAVAQLNSTTRAKGAEKRMRNAALEIEEIIDKFALEYCGIQ